MLILFQPFRGKPPVGDFVEQGRMFATVFMVSVVSSLPAFGVYLAVFYFLARRGVGAVAMKASLIGVAVVAVGAALGLLVKGGSLVSLVTIYSLAALLTGLFFRLRQTPAPVRR